MTAAIRTRALTKRFGDVLAVDGVDLDVATGDRYGFLGPNGSGKTTTVRMLLGLVHASAGEVEVLGEPIPARARKALPHVGALVEGPAFYGHLSGRTNLRLLDAAGAGGALWTRRQRVEEALERVGLASVDRRPVRAYSLGMRQRLGLAGALLRRPRLLVLDEPTNGLDPQGIREMRDLLRELNEEGTTVFLSSHLLSEVEQLCTRVGVVDRGRLVLQDDLDALRGPTGHVELDSPDAALAASLLGDRVLTRQGPRLLVRDSEPADLARELVPAGVRLDRLARERRTLEDVVLDVTGAGSDRLDAGPEGDPRGEDAPVDGRWADGRWADGSGDQDDRGDDRGDDRDGDDRDGDDRDGDDRDGDERPAAVGGSAR